MIMSNLQSQIKIQSKLSAPFIMHIKVTKGVQQGDTLVHLLYKTILEHAIRKSGIKNKRHHILQVGPTYGLC